MAFKDSDWERERAAAGALPGLRGGMRPGERIGWRAVPDRALVAVDTPHGRLYALRSGRLGLFVGGPASWCGEEDEPGWTWALAWEHSEALLVALSVPAGASADHLRQLAEDFELSHA